MVTEHTLATVAIDQFARDGELSGLLALADNLGEVGDYHFERRVRVLLARDQYRREAVRFFLRMTGRIWGEHEQNTRLRCAMEMVRFERWKGECCEVEWLEDETYNPNDYDTDMPDDGYMCGVWWNHNLNPSMHRMPRRRGRLCASLGGITFSDSYNPLDAVWAREDGHDGNYKRLVETELAEQLFGQVMAHNA